MPTGKARQSSVMEAKRKAAVNQIVAQLKGAFGDYVRAQAQAQPNRGDQVVDQISPPPLKQGGVNPGIRAGVIGTQVAPVPGSLMPGLAAGRAAMRGAVGALPPQPYQPPWWMQPQDPGFVSPGPQVVFEDGSLGAANRFPDPGFAAAANPNSLGTPSYADLMLQQALDRLRAMGAMGVGPSPDGGPPVMLPPGRRF